MAQDKVRRVLNRIVSSACGDINAAQTRAEMWLSADSEFSEAVEHEAKIAIVERLIDQIVSEHPELTHNEAALA